MTKSTRQIHKLKYGELHIYYPIKFDTNLPYSKLCEAIYNSNICFNEEYQQTIIDSLGISFANTANEFQHNISKSATKDYPLFIKVKNPDTNNNYHPCSNYNPSYEIDNENIRIEFCPTNSSLNLNVVSTELESLKQRISRLNNEFELSSKIYGNSFTSNQERLLLVPFKAKLPNDEIVWIHTLLYIFRNNMGILKLELPLIDADITPLKEYDRDSLVKSIDNCWDINNIDSNVKLSELSSYYLKSIVDSTKVNIIKYNNEIQNIILVDFDDLPKQINNIPIDIQEELFRIVSAPVPDYPYTSYSKDAREHIENYSLGRNGIKYIIKTNGGVLSLIDKQFQDYFLSKFKEENNLSALDNSDYTYICNMLANNININIEFAILIIMLKKTNVCNDIFIKKQKKHNLFKIQKEYNQNILFINELQNTCYGTVIEQTSQIEKMMPLYLKTDIINSNQTALNNILKEEEQKRNEDFLSFISIGSLMLSIIFGLPSIYEALSILRKTFFFIVKSDIPYITLENLSVMLWMVLNLFILIRIFLKK